MSKDRHRYTKNEKEVVPMTDELNDVLQKILYILILMQIEILIEVYPDKNDQFFLDFVDKLNELSVRY